MSVFIACEIKLHALRARHETSELYLFLCWLIVSVIRIINHKLSMNQIWIQAVSWWQEVR